MHLRLGHPRVNRELVRPFLEELRELRGPSRFAWPALTPRKRVNGSAAVVPTVRNQIIRVESEELSAETRRDLRMLIQGPLGWLEREMIQHILNALPQGWRWRES